MLAVRYVTLTALVIWVGALVALRWLLPATVQPTAPVALVGYACGGIILLGLLVLKFVGPPPRAFVLRMALVVLMLAAATYSGLRPETTDVARAFEIAVGVALLFWYVRE